MKGYRQLSDEEIKLIEAIKTMGDAVGAMIDNLSTIANVDRRWLAIAQTNMQQGFMAATRSIAQPTTFA